MELDVLVGILEQVAKERVTPEVGSQALASFVKRHERMRVFSEVLAITYQKPDDALMEFLDQADDIELVILYGKGVVPKRIAGARYERVFPFEAGLILSRFPDIKEFVARGEHLDDYLTRGPERDHPSRALAGYVRADGRKVYFAEPVFRQWSDH